MSRVILQNCANILASMAFVFNAKALINLSTVKSDICVTNEKGISYVKCFSTTKIKQLLVIMQCKKNVVDCEDDT